MQPDSELEMVKQRILMMDPDGARFAQVLRDTYDQLYDGQRTGRWSWADLRKTERTHMGTLVEINLHREFQFEDGDATDYRIAGAQVDCKFSMGQSKWMIPPEALGHICLVVWANDEQSSWSAGLVRIAREGLGGGERGNRDGKRTLNEVGRRSVVNLWPGVQRLPENLLLHLPASTRDAILMAGQTLDGKRGSGQARINELFRKVQDRIIDRNTIATLAQQDDYMKRVRSNLGARGHLQPEGIIILGHQKPHREIARRLGLPQPQLGEFLAVRVALANRGAANPVNIDGRWWVRATDGSRTDPAPRLPKAGSS